MSYKLKSQYESFTVVDGELAGKTFDHSTEHETIPSQEKHKFERVSPPPKAEKPRGKETDSAKEG